MHWGIPSLPEATVNSQGDVGFHVTAASVRRQDDGGLDLAAGPQHFDRNLIAMAMDAKIHARAADAQVAQDHLLEKRRQSRIAQMNLAGLGTELEAEHRLDQRERCRTRP